MKLVTRLLAVLALLAAFSPSGASAVELSRDDGTFETTEGLVPGEGRAVSFDLPAADPHALTEVALYLKNGGTQTVRLTLSVWDASLAQVYTAPVTFVYALPGWYTVDLAAAGITLDGPFRVGFATVSGLGAILGKDMAPPFGNTFKFTGTVWYPSAMQQNSGIRATVEPVLDPLPPPPAEEPPADPPVDPTSEDVPPAAPALSCEGFGPPLHTPRALRRGGRTLPLKARLSDADGFPVEADALAAAPVVQVLFTPGTGGTPVDVTEFVTPAGRSNAGTAFRLTDEGWWRHNLRSRSFAAPGAYEIRLVSGDPAEYVVEPACSAVIDVGGTAPLRGKKR